MVTPAWVFVLPTVIVSGTAPDDAPAGICKFTCIAPETRPGADPAYSTVDMLNQHVRQWRGAG